MTIHGPNGEVATLGSARPEGFLPVDINKARDFTFAPGLTAGEHALVEANRRPQGSDHH